MLDPPAPMGAAVTPWAGEGWSPALAVVFPPEMMKTSTYTALLPDNNLCSYAHNSGGDGNTPGASAH